MLSGSLGRQLFFFVSGLTLLLLVLLGSILAPTLVQQVRDMDQQRFDSQFTHAQLMMSASAQLSKTIDRFVVEGQQPELNQLFASMRATLQQQEQQVLAGGLSRSQAIDSIVAMIEPLDHKIGNHFWVTQSDGRWIYHPHGQPSEVSDYHRREFSDFINKVKRQGEASASVPWNVHYLVDSKPLIARYSEVLDVIVGMDVDASLLPQSPKESYYTLKNTLEELLQSTRFGEYGQSFFILANLNALYSLPEIDLAPVLKNNHNPLTGNRYLDDFKRAARDGKPLAILWNHIHDPENFIYPATAHVFFEPSRSAYLVSVSYADDLNYQTNQVLMEIALALLVCLLIGVFGAWWLVRRVVSPIQQLSAYAERVGQGELSLRTPLQRNDEVGILAREFNKMVAQLASTIAGLDHQVQQRTAELDRQNQELSVSLNDKETLLREVHHRVKNNLSVIIGFIQLQQRRYKGKATEALLKDLRSRVYTIELIHNQLYQANNLSHIQPSGYYQALIEEIWQLHAPPPGIHWSLTVDIEQQSLEQLLTCGQILNELLSNSLKYAFAQQTSGNIRVQFSRVSHAQIRFYFSDDGCGLQSDQGNQNGLGFTLIKHLVESKLKGQLHQNNGEQGLNWEIIFPEKE
ncbi:histidine kinase dimerization/phosphoacceptor domain -containing protein [Bacterioplanoides sp.]|uniref:histidine kinase dimerization/phosphoacceptor domain -containing protein n=1 Tax=Bacterioplanoides sp. TaxID=2066072 RepID=UPI003B00A7B2